MVESSRASTRGGLIESRRDMLITNATNAKKSCRRIRTYAAVARCARSVPRAHLSASLPCTRSQCARLAKAALRGCCRAHSSASASSLRSARRMRTCSTMQYGSAPRQCQSQCSTQAAQCNERCRVALLRPPHAADSHARSSGTRVCASGLERGRSGAEGAKSCDAKMIRLSMRPNTMVITRYQKANLAVNISHQEKFLDCTV